MKGYWNNLRPFEKRVVVGVAAMVFIIFNVWFVRPHFSDWARVKIRIAAAREKLKKYQGEVSQITTVSNQVRKLEGEGLSVPPEETSVQFLRAIQTEAARSQVNILSSGRQTERTNQFFLELSQTFNLQSSEGPLVDFLFNLGSSNSLLRVRDMTLRPDPPHQQLNAGVKLVSNYQKKAPVRVAASPAPPVKGPAQNAPNASNTNVVKAPVRGSKGPIPLPAGQTNKPPTKNPTLTPKRP